jgi:hypothetical protein
MNENPTTTTARCARAGCERSADVVVTFDDVLVVLYCVDDGVAAITDDPDARTMRLLRGRAAGLRQTAGS